MKPFLPIACIAFLVLSLGCSESVTDPGSDATIDSGADATTDSGADGGSDTGADTGPADDYFACEYVGDCVLASTTCCGVCGAPSASDVASVNVDQAENYRNEVACPVPDDMCPDCPSMLNPSLAASCATTAPSAGTCEVLDAATAEFASCSEDADCMVRTPACCECGADVNRYALVAFSTDGLAAWLPRVCDPRADCAACAPVYPDDVVAECVEGLCQIAPPAP